MNSQGTPTRRGESYEALPLSTGSMKGLAAVTILVALAPVGTASIESPSETPTAAWSFRAEESDVVVAWLPGEALADSYHVYGLGLAGWTLLEVVEADDGEGPFGAIVPGGFESYGVATSTGGSGGMVSAPLTSVEIPCAFVQMTTRPPQAGLGWCPVDLPGTAGVRLE